MGNGKRNLDETIRRAAADVELLGAHFENLRSQAADLATQMEGMAASTRAIEELLGRIRVGLDGVGQRDA